MAKKRAPRKTPVTHRRKADQAASVNGAEIESHGGELESTHGDGDVAHAYEEGGSIGRFVGRIVYQASYTVSYGIVFPVMLVAYTIPTENALVRGLIDGGHAARDAVGALHSDSAHEGSEETAEAEPATA